MFTKKSSILMVSTVHWPKIILFSSLQLNLKAYSLLPDDFRLDFIFDFPFFLRRSAHSIHQTLLMLVLCSICECHVGFNEGHIKKTTTIRQSVLLSRFVVANIQHNERSRQKMEKENWSVRRKNEKKKTRGKMIAKPLRTIITIFNETFMFDVRHWDVLLLYQNRLQLWAANENVQPIDSV